MPWFIFPLMAPCVVVIVIVIVVAIRPSVSGSLAEVLREVPPIVTALLPVVRLDRNVPRRSRKRELPRQDAGPDGR